MVNPGSARYKFCIVHMHHLLMSGKQPTQTLLENPYRLSYNALAESKEMDRPWAIENTTIPPSSFIQPPQNRTTIVTTSLIWEIEGNLKRCINQNHIEPACSSESLGFMEQLLWCFFTSCMRANDSVWGSKRSPSNALFFPPVAQVQKAGRRLQDPPPHGHIGFLTTASLPLVDSGKQIGYYYDFATHGLYSGLLSIVSIINTWDG